MANSVPCYVLHCNRDDGDEGVNSRISIYYGDIEAKLVIPTTIYGKYWEREVHKDLRALVQAIETAIQSVERCLPERC